MPDLSRRHFLMSSGAALAGSAAGMAQGRKRLRMALVGTGGRGTHTWGKPVIEWFKDDVEIVGLCDINGKRVKASQAMLGIDVPTFTDFDAMVKTVKPDRVMVTTVDGTHARYIVRALELGCEAMTEKPMCTDEAQCQAILDAQKRTKGKVIVTFNARHGGVAKKVKQLLMEKAIGDVISVDFHEYLDTSHGADYFRRWHRMRENSGTLLCHKASHHFDQANWWLDASPVEVAASGSLKFYGRNNPFRGTNCRICPYKQQCKFHWDMTKNAEYVKLYAECESEDGYFRDGCLWAENTNIYDTMSVRVNYDNGVLMTYTANTYVPYEGQAISFNGTKGRLDANHFRGGGHGASELRLTRSFGKSELVQIQRENRPGGHGGSDTAIQELVFRNQDGPDPLGLRADLYAGAKSSLIGIAAYRSIDRGGAPVKISDLVKL
jgi:predicted dehydrogenase